MSVAVSSAFVRPADIDGVPSVEWVMARYRREWQGAKSDRQRAAAFAAGATTADEVDAVFARARAARRANLRAAARVYGEYREAVA